MKTLFRLFLTLFAGLTLTVGCIDFFLPEDENLPQGVVFYTTVQGLSFFFVDGDGNDLVDFDDKTTWPQAYPQKVGDATRVVAVERVEMTAREDGRVFYIYNDNCNALAKDLDTRLWSFTTYFWGRTPEPEYTTYFYAGGGLDSLKVSFSYLSGSNNDNTPSAPGWGVKVDSVKYNGVEVMVGNETGKVFIQKPSRDQTVVKVGRL
ncbi:MAG: hypothetical protein IJ636_05445 [Bacteroidales bacterium]|nr:hypothetical protein [Bacteroidales bacterium]